MYKANDASNAAAFKGALDRQLLFDVFQFNLKNQYVLRDLGLRHASWLANTMVWLRDIPPDHLYRLLFRGKTLAFRRHPAAWLERTLGEPETQRTYQQVLDRFAYLFGRLDQAGQDLLVHVAAMRVLGPRQARIPGMLERLQQGAPDLRAALRQAVPSPGNEPGEFLFDFRPFPSLAFPVTCIMHRLMLADLLVLGQYDHPDVHVVPGDVVLEGGAFKGETSLWLACRTTATGKVFAFEFIARHIAGLRENMARNPALREQIEIVPAALWSRSGMPVYCARGGGGSSISFDDRNGGERVAETLTIDDFVARQAAPRLDFIKLDIEGAELETLRGAAHTLQTLKPKLGISIYHSLEDFDAIPRFLDGLNAGYQFRLGHHSLGIAETVLYGTARETTT